MNARNDAPVRCDAREYESLTQAVAHAAAGDTLVLQSDITLRQTLVLDKAVTLTTDGVRRTIRAEHSGPVLHLTAAATVAGAGEDAPLVIDGCGAQREDALVHLAGEGSLFRHVTLQGGCCRGCGGGDSGRTLLRPPSWAAAPFGAQPRGQARLPAPVWLPP